jgi:Tfp pilus assembly protein PilF
MAPSLADGYISRAILRIFYFFDWQGAQVDLDHALALEPSNAGALSIRAYLYGGLGRMPEAIGAARRSVELAPLSVGFQRTLALLLIDDGQLAQADAVGRQLLTIAPDNPSARVTQARILFAKGDYAASLALMRRYDATFGYFMTSIIDHRLGDAAGSQAALDRLIAQGATTFAYQIAEAYALRGQADKAFEWLDRAVAQHDGGVVYLKRDAMLAPLRADPRFAALLRRLKLPQ